MKIEDFKDRQMFTTPEGYFGQLNNKILSATSNTGSTTAKRRPISIWARVSGYAAAIAILLVIAVKTTTGDTITEATAANQERYDEEILDNEFIDNMLSSYPIDDYTFYCYLTEEETNQ